MSTILLNQGYVALVDDCDFERVSAYKWYVLVRFRVDGSTRVYASRKVKKPNSNWTTQSLHRFIMAAPVGMEVDHIDGNPLNNCRANLRLCTSRENNQNRRPKAYGSSAYKGVSWDKRHQKWAAQIMLNGKQKCIGRFLSELEAANAYDAAAIEMFGAFARINVYPAVRAELVSGK